ncbi:hypothetical protein GEMRC1_012999 [Eukaryota sp. GEM-RC1]
MQVSFPDSLLHELYLSRCKDLDEVPSTSRFTDFKRMFPQPSSILNLRDYSLGPYAAAVISKLIRRFEFSSLILYDNLLRDNGVQTILQTPSTPFYSLNIGANDCTDSLAYNLSHFFQRCSSIHTLILGHSLRKPPTYPNQFSAKTLSTIITSAISSSSLRTLNLNGCLKSLHPDDSALRDDTLASSISSLISSSTNINHLHIGGLRISDEDLITISTVLPFRKPLSH